MPLRLAQFVQVFGLVQKHVPVVELALELSCSKHWRALLLDTHQSHQSTTSAQQLPRSSAQPVDVGGKEGHQEQQKKNMSGHPSALAFCRQACRADDLKACGPSSGSHLGRPDGVCGRTHSGRTCMPPFPHPLARSSRAAAPCASDKQKPDHITAKCEHHAQVHAMQHVDRQCRGGGDPNPLVEDGVSVFGVAV